jgi:hypothetical protein
MFSEGQKVKCTVAIRDGDQITVKVGEKGKVVYVGRSANGYVDVRWDKGWYSLAPKKSLVEI